VAFLAAALMLAAGGAILALALRPRHVRALQLDPAALPAPA
jgi:hypothetical protein